MAVQTRTPFSWVLATRYLVPDVSKEHSAFIFLCLQVDSRLRVQRSKNYSYTSETIQDESILPKHWEIINPVMYHDIPKEWSPQKIPSFVTMKVQ
jgi:hypothetical protein